MSLTIRTFLALALACGLTTAARADLIHNYTIVQNQSQLNLTVTGSALGGALTVTEQQPSAITRYNGTLKAFFPGGPAVGGSIEFPGDSSANAVNPTGLFSIPLPYSPNVNGGAGTAPANYGVNLNAPIAIDIPPVEIPGFGTIDLGSLQSVNIAMAIRDLVLDVDSTGSLSIAAAGAFDANGTNLSINSGFADINGGLVFDQANIVETLAVAAFLTAIDVALPDLNLTVSTNLIATTVTLGIGTRLDLGDLGAISIPNGAAADGTVTYSLPSGSSTLTLPVLMQLPSLADLGIPAEILDLQLSLSGQLVATAIVPEPSTIVLAASGLVGLFFLARRRKR